MWSGFYLLILSASNNLKVSRTANICTNLISSSPLFFQAQPLLRCDTFLYEVSNSKERQIHRLMNEHYMINTKSTISYELRRSRSSIPIDRLSVPALRRVGSSLRGRESQDVRPFFHSLRIYKTHQFPAFPSTNSENLQLGYRSVLSAVPCQLHSHRISSTPNHHIPQSTKKRITHIITLGLCPVYPGQ